MWAFFGTQCSPASTTTTTTGTMVLFLIDVEYGRWKYRCTTVFRFTLPRPGKATVATGRLSYQAKARSQDRQPYDWTAVTQTQCSSDWLDQEEKHLSQACFCSRCQYSDCCDICLRIEVSDRTLLWENLISKRGVLRRDLLSAGRRLIEALDEEEARTWLCKYTTAISIRLRRRNAVTVTSGRVTLAAALWCRLEWQVATEPCCCSLRTEWCFSKQPHQLLALR